METSGLEDKKGDKMIYILSYIGCTYSSWGRVISYQNIRKDDRGA